jgi:hypothetical protein
MTTIKEMIEIIRAENPNGLRLGDEENGYIQMSDADYETQIEIWAQGRLDRDARIVDIATAEQAKADAAIKLSALGIDPKALGL